MTQPTSKRLLTEANAAASYLPRQRPQIHGVPLYGRGTSYMAGAASTTGNSFIELVAAALGSSAMYNGGNGGSTTPALVYQYAQDAAHLWTPGVSTGLVLLEAGIGEALNEETTNWLGYRNTFENKVVTALRWHRATALKKANDASIVLDGTGATLEAVTGQPAYDVNPGLKLTAVGGGATITVPTFAAPTDIVLLTVPWAEPSGTATGDNSDFRYRVNTGPWSTGTTTGQGDPRPTGNGDLLTISSIRIPAVPSGATIRVERTGSGNVWLYGYLVMGAAAPTPVVLINDVYLNETNGQWTFTDGGHTTGPRKNNATLDVYRDIMRRIAQSAEFNDGTVVVADPNPRFDPTTMLSSVDELHPNNTGHAVYAAAIIDALQLLS